MLELKIFSPQESGFVPEIKWNNEELKVAIAEKMKEYNGLVFTEETISEGKKDRANLNKLRGAIDDERKRVKKLCMEPCNRFEKEVKEVLALVDEQINAIDVQIKEVEQIKREEKRKAVQELFESIGFQKFVTLEMIWDEKWLNASVTLSKVENQMKETMYRIGEEVGWKSIRRHWILRRQSRKDRSWLTFRRERKKRLPDRKLRKREEKQRKLLQEKSQRIRKKLRILIMRLKKPRRMTIQELFQNRS
ncbi:MAG: hypothetical protein BHW17_09120 [Dorea sp. 42_8]|nr:MAG: hypothetical protein BHW17_09120 [Dorea sp. 42_8]